MCMCVYVYRYGMYLSMHVCMRACLSACLSPTFHSCLSEMHVACWQSTLAFDPASLPRMAPSRIRTPGQTALNNARITGRIKESDDDLGSLLWRVEEGARLKGWHWLLKAVSKSPNLGESCFPL